MPYTRRSSRASSRTLAPLFALLLLGAPAFAGCGDDDGGGTGGGAGGGAGGGSGGGAGGGSGGGAGGGAGGGTGTDGGDLDGGQDAAVPTGQVPIASELDALFDPDFGSGGWRAFPLSFSPYAIAVQADGKILLGGNLSDGTQEDAAVMRLLADGSPDPSFGIGGLVTIPVHATYYDNVRSLRIASDGAIVAGGVVRAPAPPYFDVFAIRLDGFDGTPVASFGGDGVVVFDDGDASTHGGAVAPTSDGGLFLAGSASVTGGVPTTDFVLLRYDETGALDGAFDGDGVRRYDLSGVENLADVRLSADQTSLFLAGSLGAVPQIGVVMKVSTATGDPDAGFGASGVATISATYDTSVDDLELDADGLVVFSGAQMAQIPDGDALRRHGMMGRLLANGSPDPSFGTGGLLVAALAASGEEYITSVLVRGDGSLFGTGRVSPSGLRIVSVTALGALDATFGGDGIMGDAAFAVANLSALAPDGDLLVVTFDPVDPWTYYLLRLEP